MANIEENSTIDTSIIKINATSYSIEEKWLEIAKKYFNINDDDMTAIHLLKTGFFGYFNEIAANEIKNSVAHRNFLYDEHFLNSASAPKSIFNFAKTYNVTIDNATPSHMYAVIDIRKDILLDSNLKEAIYDTDLEGSKLSISSLNPSYRLTIDDKYKFSISGVSFLLPYPVDIIMKPTVVNGKTDYSITAHYDISGYTFPFMNINSPYIKTWQDSVEGYTHEFFMVDLFNMTKKTAEFNIVSEDVSDNLFYDVKYTDMIAYFNVYYTYNGVTERINVYFNNTYVPENDEKFCYYTFVDDDKLEISFSSAANSFRPRFNSIITVDFYTTLGQAGNFEYSGAMFVSSSDNAESFDKISLNIYNISNPTNGSNKLTTSEMKTKIIEKITTRDNLITDNDLLKYFETVNSSLNINNGKILFMKKRDDVLRRVFNSFILLKDSGDRVIPTNTMSSVDLVLKDTEDDYYIIPDNSIFSITPKEVPVESSIRIKDRFDYKYRDDLFISYNDKIKRDEVINVRDKSLYNIDNNELIYANPFLIKIDTEPVLRASYFKMYINSDFSTNYTFSNNVLPTNFLINTITVNKLESNGIDSDSYGINMYVNSDNALINENDSYFVLGMLYNKSTGVSYGYFNLSKQNVTNNSADITSFLFSGALSTNKKFSKKDELILYDSLVDKNGNTIENVPISENVGIKVAVIYKSDISYTATESTSDMLVFSNEVVNLKEVLNDTEESPVKMYYSVALVVDTLDIVHLYTNLSNCMMSTVKHVTSYDVEGSSKFTLEMLPLIGLKYFLYKNDNVYKLIDDYLTVMEDSMDKLENNTNIDIKFFNTFGPSQYYFAKKDVIVNEVIEEQTYALDRINVLMNIDIYLKRTISDDYYNCIIEFIAKFVEECNEKEVFPVSNLLRLLETNFDYIKFIEFNGISDENDFEFINNCQLIETEHKSVNDLTKQEIIEYVPEFLNLKKNIIISTFTDETGEVVETGNIYDYLIHLNTIS